MHSAEDTTRKAIEAADVPPPIAYRRQSIGRLAKLALTFMSVIAIALVVFSFDVEEFSGYKIMLHAPFLCPVFPEISAYAVEGRTNYLAFQDNSDCGDMARLPRDQYSQDYVFTVSDVAVDNGKTTIQSVVRCEYSQQS